jgi:hypothetical protein
MPAVDQTVTMSRRPSLGLRLIPVAEEYFDIPAGSVQNPKRRNGRISQARWAISHVLAQEAGWSEPKIGQLFGCNPSSINTGKRRASELLRSDAVFFDGVRRLQREISPQ